MKKKQATRMLFNAGRYRETQMATAFFIGEQHSLTAALCILASAYNQVLGGNHV